MNLKQRLKFEKEIYFLKYIFQKPFDYIGESIWELVIKPKNWLFAEFILLIFFLWRNLFLYIFNHFGMVFDKLTIITLIVIFTTFVIKVYFGQDFQNDYKQDKEKKIKC